MKPIRVIAFAITDGAVNMATDEVMLHGAAQGIASLRFYGWTTATVSLGYFQPAAVRLADPNLTSLPWVRRPSGGATLVHHHELTYALALPPDRAWHAEPWMPRMHRIIAQALSELGVLVQPVTANPVRHGDVLCFQQHTPGDLLCVGSKVVGSAQRKYRLALMQHGSILLARSEHTPQLPGIRELTAIDLTATQLEAALQHTFAVDTAWQLQSDDWKESERQAIRQLADEKYAGAAWNARR